MINPYHLASSLLSVAVLIAYLNHRFIRLQSTIAIMLSALLLALILIVLEKIGLIHVRDQVQSVLQHIHFQNLLLNGFLSFLLFAGSLTVDIDALRSNLSAISLLAIISTVVSTLLISVAGYYLLPLIGLHLPLLWCCLLGALISPTDPIAVLATFKKLGAPRDLQVCVSGEALFNDGVGIVIFTTLLSLLQSTSHATTGSVLLLFCRQSLGGLIYGALLGWFFGLMLRSINDGSMKILLSLAIVTGGYAFAQILNISGPLAMVMAGLIIGAGLKKNTQQHALTLFWESIDELFNAILFLLLGFELLLIDFSPALCIAMGLSIPLVFMIRYVSVWLALSPLTRLKHKAYPVFLISWGGLRGGLAIALALSLPAASQRSIVLSIAYGIVGFSVIVQGLSMPKLLRWFKIKHKMDRA